MTGNTKTFPGFDHLYQMGEDYEKNCFYADLEDGTPQKKLLRGEWVPDTPLQAHWSMKKSEPGDIGRGTSLAWYYLSPRVQQLFRENDLTGWSTYPITLYNKAGELCPGYVGFSITGRCGSKDNDRGKVVPGQEGKEFAEHIGLYFDESTWDGSDFFCPAGENSYKFCTEKVKNLFNKHEIRGFDFTSLAEATWIP